MKDIPQTAQERPHQELPKLWVEHKTRLPPKVTELALDGDLGANRLL